MSTDPHGPHALDALGTRDVSSEAKAIAQKAASTRTPSSDPPSFDQTPGVEMQLLKSIAYSRLLPIPRPTVSTFVPSAHMMYAIMQAMDYKLMSVRHFSSELPRWTPLHTRLYYGTLFYIQTMRAMDSVGALAATNRVLLQQILEKFSPDALPVAGPMVVFFKALTACESPQPEYGPVTPFLPINTGMVLDQQGALPETLRVLLPNLSAIKNAIHTTRNPAVNNVPVQWDRNLANPAANAPQAPPAHDIANNHMARDARITPGTVNPLQMTTRDLVYYANNTPSHLVVPQAPAVVHNMLWINYLNFNTDLRWFGSLAAQMHRHAQFFRGSTTLQACSPKNGASALIICQQQAAYPNRNDHRAMDIDSIELEAIASSITDVVPAPSDLIGMFTQINWIPSPMFGPNDLVAAPNVTRTGPIWAIQPIRSQSHVLDPVPSAENIIQADYLLDKAVNPAYPSR